MTEGESILSKISVIMSVFNESIKELKASINSILLQNYSNFEFIILDDNPQSSRIKRFLINMDKSYSKIRLFVNDKNLGAALSRNKGVRHARSDFIAIMDADDVANKNRLKSQINFLKRYNLDLVFPNYKRISENGNIINKNTYSMKSIIDQSEIYYIFSKVRDIGINSGWLMKKRLFERLNGYRNVIVEDYDFIIRALSLGYRLGYQQDILMSVRFRLNSTMRANALKIYLATKYFQHFLSKKKHLNIGLPSIKDINNFIERHSNYIQERRFNNLLKVCHSFKYNKNVHNFVLLICNIFLTKYSINFIFNTIKSSLELEKLS